MIFGWKLVRKTDLNEIDFVVRDMYSHVNDNAKFMDDKGLADKGYDNTTVYNHWHKLNELMKKYFTLRRAL